MLGLFFAIQVLCADWGKREAGAIQKSESRKSTIEQDGMFLASGIGRPPISRRI